MKRRSFIKNSALASSMLMVPSFLKALELKNSPLNSIKKLVIIQLSGGNDGLNTVIPFRNDIYYRNRSKLGIPKNNLIQLNDDVGLNLNMAPLAELYDKGYLSIINNVGYPNPNRSHFRSTDIWHTASGSDKHLVSGWIGRYLDTMDNNHPHSAIEINHSLSLIMKGEYSTGLATPNPQFLYKSIGSPLFQKLISSQDDTHLSEHNLGYLYKTMINANSSAKYLYEKSKVYSNNSEYPNNNFGKQLKTTARFINSEINTSVYYVSMSGYDTHVNQFNKQNKLLKTYSDGINAFVKDLESNNTFKDTLILTFSEFGRRLKENGSKGTDHGAANNVFLIGKNLKQQGLVNEMPNLNDLDKGGDIKYTVDFRSIYAELLNDWLGSNDEQILGKKFTKLNLI